MVGCLVADQRFVDAQNFPSTFPVPLSQACPARSDNDKPAGPEISIAQVAFSGDLRLPVSEQEAIAESIKQTTHNTDLYVTVDEALERARAGWQDRGYFKVEVSGDTKVLTASPVSQRIVLDVHVDEGLRYRLSGISFKNNKAIKSHGRLRQFFPINDGDIFSREKIATGLENLRKAYGEIGYINFTSVPDTVFNDDSDSISLVIDIDEGKQFRVGAIQVVGLDDAARESFVQSLPAKVGQVYNSKTWEKTALTQSSLPICDCPDRWQRLYNEKSGVVTLSFDFRPCTAN